MRKRDIVGRRTRGSKSTQVEKYRVLALSNLIERGSGIKTDHQGFLKAALKNLNFLLWAITCS